MGAAMATAAVDTILRYFDESGKSAQDFDYIVTGDLGSEGFALAEELLCRCGFDHCGRLVDCGMLILRQKETGRKRRRLRLRLFRFGHRRIFFQQA